MTVNIEQEAKDIANAPRVAQGPTVGRCSFCGRVATKLTPVDVVHGQERFKCEVCRA